MKRLFRAIRLIASCAGILSSTVAFSQPQLRLQRVVLLMRHGVRPPTKLQPIPVEYSPLPWPAWPVGPGMLTPHGAMAVERIAAWDRTWLVENGILPAVGCPPSGQVTALASKTPRAYHTAETWVATALPNCGVVVQHPTEGQPDLLFHILETKPAWFDGHRAYLDAISQAPRGSIALQMLLLAPDMQRMGYALACADPCPLNTEESTLVEQEHDAPKFKGPFDYASTASESFLLEYDEGMPMSSVAWGRVTSGDIARLLIFNSTKFKYLNRPPYIAKASAGPLARVILTAFNSPTASSLTILGGHDTNIAALGGLIGLHWPAPSTIADDVPPASALGFELLTDGSHQSVRVFFRSQTMDQIRYLTPLKGARNQPYREYLQIPGCPRATAEIGCDLRTFTRIVEGKLR